FDVVGVNRVDVDTLQSIDDYQWLVASLDGVHTANPDRRLSARLTACIKDHDPSSSSLQRLVYTLHGKLGQFRALHRTDGAGEIAFALGSIADDDHFLKGFQVGREGDVKACAPHHGYFGRLISYIGDDQRLRISREIEGKSSINIRCRANGCAFDNNAGAGQALAILS